MAGYRGQQGRKPKPTTIVEKQKERQDSGLQRLPPSPDYLTAKEKAEWTRVGRQLIEAGLICKLDSTVLAAYCTAFGRWIEAQDSIRKHGVLVKSPSGFPMQSPYLSISNKAMEQMIKLMSELGMTPASRTRIPKSEQVKPKNKTNVQPSGKDPRGILGVVQGGA